MEKYSIGKIADWETGKKFSCESIESDSFGGHQFWLNNKNWKNNLCLKCNINYYKYKTIYVISNNLIDLKLYKFNEIKLELFLFVLEKNKNIKVIDYKYSNEKFIIINETNVNFANYFSTYSIINMFNKNEILSINDNNLINDYNIIFGAIYFPQFHKIPENDKFWGEGFTEWTLLKPYKPYVEINDRIVDILKPNKDIGYYDLNFDTFVKQVNMSDKYGIDVFLTYHYWFANSHKVMYKPLEFYKKVKKRFCLCWANEPWSRRWDGSSNETLLVQTYNNYHEMIVYLYDFFKLENYLRDENNNIIYYIYNFNHIGIDNLKCLKEIWKNYLNQFNEKIKFIFYSTSTNKNIKNEEMCYFFEPLENNSMYYKNDYKSFDKYWRVDYLNILNFYKGISIETLKNKIQGVCLNWNNIVRRKNLKYLYVDNFNIDNLIKLLTYQIGNILLSHNGSKKLNMINFNAWNEWNEQAVLEPTETTGYSNLKAIKYFKDKLLEPLCVVKPNILLIDVYIDICSHGGAGYTSYIIELLSKKYNVFYHPNTNTISDNFNNFLKNVGGDTLLATNILDLSEFKKYNFKKIIISRMDNHFYYNRLINVYPDTNMYYILTHDIQHLRDKHINKTNEFNILQKYNKCIMISPFEIEYLKENNFTDNKLIYLPPKLKYKINNYISSKRKDIVFIGSQHEPNITGIQHFINTYFKAITKKLNINLHIIGTCCDYIKIDSNSTNIIKHGYVENLDKILTNIRINIAPLISGAGVKIKILDGLNVGIPLIATKKAIEGIDLQDNFTYYNLEMFDDVNEYVNKFVNIYNNEKSLNSISSNQKDYFKSKFTYNVNDDIELSLLN